MKRNLLLLIAVIISASSIYAWKPQFAGHRGSLRGVMNTAEAYRNGADYYKYQGLECDVRVTKDGYYVICHDETTANYCSTSLTIASSTLAQLKALTFTQTRDGVKYTGKICTVEEYLDICVEKGCFPIIELKYTTGINSNSMTNFPGLWNLVKSKGLEKKAIFLTSMQNSLQYIKENYPEAHCQYLMYTDSDARFAFCKKYGIDASMQTGGPTAAIVKKYNDAGLQVAVWTINSEANYTTYGNMGCTMMTCDYLRPENMPEITAIPDPRGDHGGTTTDPEPENKLNNAPLSKLQEKWNLSVNNGNTESKGYDATKIRNFCYNAGKLYCVYNHSDILVLNARTGEKLGVLDKGGVVAGGTLALCDVKAIDGHIIACNLVTAASGDEFRLYVWDNDNEPAKLLKTITDFRGAPRIGDCMEISGSYDGDMYFTFLNDDNTTTRLFEFWRLGGANWNGKSYNVTTNGTTRLAVTTTARASKRAGGWWIDGNGNVPQFVALNSDGVAVATGLKLDTGVNWTSSFREFKWLDDNYIATSVFNAPNGTASDNYKAGRVRLWVCNAPNLASPINVCDYPSGGLSSTTQNTNGTVDCQVSTNGSSYVEIWVNSTNQGLCYYAHGDVPAYDVNPIDPNAKTISVDKKSIELSAEVGASASATVNVSSSNISGNITATLSCSSDFSIDRTAIAGSGAITITYAPTEGGSQRAELTLNADGAEEVLVSILGIASVTIDPTKPLPVTHSCVWLRSQSEGDLPNNFPSKTDANYTNGQQCAVVDGKFYVNDANKKAILIFDATTTDPVVVPYSATGWGGSPCLGITSDDAGNIIQRFETSNGAAPGTLRLFRHGSTVPVTVTFSLGDNGAQSNFITAAGDVFSAEGGYVYYLPNGKTVVSAVHIANGAYVKTLSYNVSLTGSTASLITPIKAPDCFYYMVRNNSINLYDGVDKGVVLNGASTTAPARNSSIAGGYVSLGGHDLMLHASGTNYNGGWTLRDMTVDATPIVTYPEVGNGGYNVNASCGTFTKIVKVDDTMARIYNYTMGNGYGVYEIVCEGVTGVDNVPAVSDGTFTAFPNPVITTTALCSSKPLGKVQIFGMDGRLVKSVALGDVTAASLDLSDLHRGFYILVTENGQRLRLAKK